MAEKRQATRKTTTAPKQLSFRERVTTRTRDYSSKYYDKTTVFIKSRPLASFLIVLGLLLLLLIAGRLLQKAPVERAEHKITKAVTVYSIGEGPQAAFQAKIEKSGVVQIVAQAGGIVQDIPAKEGQEINKGQLIVSLSNNYQGGNAGSIQREIAQKQYQNTLDNFGPQLDIINRQRDVATASAKQADLTREITKQSSDETSGLINANQTQLDQLKSLYVSLQQNPPAEDSDLYETYQALPAQINQLQGGINQLRSAQRSTELQSNEDKPGALLSNLQEEIALKQLDVQEKSLNLGKEVSKLQVSLAYVNEAIMYPSSPFTGTVEKINVREGQIVNPGTVLATITSNKVETSAVLLVPQNIAQVIATGEPSYLQINGKFVAVTPYYISTQATDGQLFSVFYDIPADVQTKVSDGQYISITVPLGKAKTSAANPLIPIDAVYQNQDKAYVLVAEKEQAVTRTITTGNVYGSYVEIANGLRNGDQIILNRNVIAGDKVKIQ